MLTSTLQYLTELPLKFITREGGTEKVESEAATIFFEASFISPLPKV